MTRAKEGDRVGAVASTEGTRLLRLYGFGTYRGHRRPSEMDDKPCGTLGDMVVNADSENPVIELDDGNYIWGCECWWGSEQVVKQQLDKYETVENVSIAETRWQYEIASGKVRKQAGGETDFGNLQFGGSPTSFPKFRRT